MTKGVVIWVIVAPEGPVKCEYCGKIVDCRPCGENGKEICFECAMMPDRVDSIRRNARRILFGDE